MAVYKKILLATDLSPKAARAREAALQLAGCDAIDAFGSSAFMRDAFGDEVVEHLLHFARSEQEVYDKAVTDYERARYFERI